MKYYFDQHIGIFENAVPKEWCEKVIKLYEDNSNQSRSRQEDENNIPSNFKRDHILPLEVLNKDMCLEFNKNFWNLHFHPYSIKYTLSASMSTENIHLHGFKIQKTLPAEGYHLWHCEHDSKYPFRVMAYTLYLNNVKEGGETEFLHQSKRIPPKQGTLCIFPASYTHFHRGNPPLSGEKYIMTGWIQYYPEMYHKSINFNSNE